jgi:hypothetical protein
MPRKEFEGFTRLDASDVNTYLMDQSVMTFGSATARDAAIDTPVEGMAAYLNDSNILSLYDGSAWKNSLATTGGILQVVSTTKTDTFSASVASAASSLVTGLTATITPSSVSSKILVIANVNGSGSGRNSFFAGLDAGGTLIAIGDAASSRTRVGGGQYVLASSDTDHGATISLNTLHSPATTSPITYGVKVINSSGGTLTLYVNRSLGDTNNSSNFRSASTITLMEVAG